MPPKIGAFTFVLHSHLPYARLAGRWPHGEEWLHEAAAETYLPLLDVLYRLRGEGLPFHLTLGITPVLAEQLADDLIKQHLDDYLDDRIARAKRDILRFRASREPGSSPQAVKTRRPFEAAAPEGPPVEMEAVSAALAAADAAQDGEGAAQAAMPEAAHLERLARHYQRFYERAKYAFNVEYQRDIPGAFRRLQDEGYIEIITSAATHGYLPLLGTDRAIEGQLKTAIASYQRIFGRAPQAIWLPECAYRPAYESEDGQLRPGLEYFLAQQGLKLFFGESHMVTRAQPVEMQRVEMSAPRASQPAPPPLSAAPGPILPLEVSLPGSEAFTLNIHQQVARDDGPSSPTAKPAPPENHESLLLDPFSALRRRYRIPLELMGEPFFQPQTSQVYYVSDSTGALPALGHSGVAILARNAATSQQVWSAAQGYPGDFDYREFHRKDAESGLQYWRISGQGVDLGAKALYDPAQAARKAAQHAAHFVEQVEQITWERHSSGQGYGIIAANYDTELFGHWWHEGLIWLEAVLRGLVASGSVALTSASTYLEQHPPQAALHVPEGSWGSGGSHFTWNNPQTQWMWPPLHQAEQRLSEMASRHRDDWADETLCRVLNQAARELLLAESSDWPFLVSTEQARDYAIRRFGEHLERCSQLLDSIAAGQPDAALAAELWYRDRVFPDVDYRWWSL